MTRALAIAALLALALGPGAGCKRKSKADTSTTTPPADDGDDGTAPVEPEAPKLVIHVQADDDGNAGRPLRAVVRLVAFKDFVEDQYQDIAALVIEPDESVLASFVVYPGHSRVVAIDKPEGTVAVYGLFIGATGTSWKRLYDAPERIELIAGRDRLLDPKAKSK
ncbi:hypothetical protein [Paraliomyxa miuraensis]|uniref:hypothetical protein n=1 Tax=Paraliomyxa miuraensis TaxID=376150 RepID=UPI002258AC02|nr:hypothetical protein [Paraliomyxa miuraensis]MCX4244138.1 hypothetical protein [Paraliomyxa miuraensis]